MEESELMMICGVYVVSVRAISERPECYASEYSLSECAVAVCGVGARFHIFVLPRSTPVVTGYPLSDRARVCSAELRRSSAPIMACSINTRLDGGHSLSSHIKII